MSYFFTRGNVRNGCSFLHNIISNKKRALSTERVFLSL